MYFKASGRVNPSTKRYESYYRLVESYRSTLGRICHRTILNIGFLEDDLHAEQLNTISRTLTDIYQQKTSIFPNIDPLVNKWVSFLWSKIVINKRLDLTLYDENSRMVNADTMQHSNARDIGAEWMCYNTWQQLGIDKVLIENDFSESEIQLAQTQVISRALYPCSELATTKWIKENSAITELTGYPLEKMNKDRLYKSALKLNSIKTQLEQHLSIKTNELFDIQDKIVLYDLTNTYFEGEKRNSKLAKYGRSKEKRSDCKLIVLALVVNIYGFIKHSSIHEGNFSDCSGIEAIITSLDNVIGKHKPVSLFDADIATKENLATDDLGKYFIRTSMDMKQDVIVWNVNNTIRKIENTFRTLKTDLDLRPINHKKDESTIAHLNLGLLSYWIANTIRCQLKLNGINYCWKEIVRIGNTQKVITTAGYNKANHEIIVRKCTEPEEKLKALHTALKIKNRPFTKLKSVYTNRNKKNRKSLNIKELHLVSKQYGLNIVGQQKNDSSIEFLFSIDRLGRYLSKSSFNEMNYLSEEGYYQTTANTFAAINIAKIDKANKIISGTFSFTAENKENPNDISNRW